MQYGFAIDQRTCIGCHACTVACKTEHEVPLGQFRTWVKYVETGAFPATTREMGVMRCNHCTDAPCVKICPTEALFKRDDGIVDFDSSACIGCKACMQACPYDAIYIDEDTDTAAKCNFCAHRVDEGLEPACVVVCPTESIWVGDLHDPTSAISQFVSTNQTQVRAPEQGTGPNVHYVGADRTVLDPLAAPVDDTYIWAQPDTLRKAVASELPGDPVTNARTVLNTAHPVPWGWKVTTYLWTKAVGAGALMIAALALLVGVDLGSLGTIAAPAIALAGTAATGVLLVTDLKRPERFYYLLTRGNRTSWLVKGAYVLGAYAALASLWLVLGIAGAEDAIRWLAAPAAAAGLMTAAYTGYLFGQAEGRDLWQSPLLFWHLIVQALMVGAGGLWLASLGFDTSQDTRALLARVLAVATAGHLLMLLVEHTSSHATQGAATAARMITRGRHSRVFWASVGAAGLALLLAPIGWGGEVGAAAVGIAAIVVHPALLAYEHVFVRAPQEVPLS